jgi:hypothetical protein
MPRQRSLIAILAMLIGGPPSAFADEAKPDVKTADAPVEDGSKPLFDGESLKNWKKADFLGGSDVSVKDGELIIPAGKPMSGIAWSGGDLPKVDYELSFEAKRADGQDFFVGLTFPVNDDPCTLILGGWGGNLTGFSSIDGADASENETTGFSKFETGKWYKVRLRVSGARVDAWIDGKKVSGFDHRGRKLSVRIEVEANRPLGFATYRTTGAYRKIQLRELSADEKKAAIEEADKILKEKE